MIEFVKMHGLGNDYVYIDCFHQQVVDPEELAVQISDRHFGVGSDGLILVCPSEVADVKMRMFNADGSEAQMCGNGIRCLAKYFYENHPISASSHEMSVPGQGLFPASIQVQTGRGILTVGLELDEGNKVSRVCVNMGQPILEASQIPVAIAAERVVDLALPINDQSLSMTCVSMGNPHAVFFCEDLDAIDLSCIGPRLEHHELFPERINVHFVKSDNPQEFTMQTWERRQRITLAWNRGLAPVL